MHSFHLFLLALVAFSVCWAAPRQIPEHTSPTTSPSSATPGSAKYVYAHFVVGNAAHMTTSDWESDITLAKSAHIDGFALNIGGNDPNNAEVLTNAFCAAELVGGFTLFLSFDYPSGPWAASDATKLINQYKTSSAQAYYLGKPLVSTFGGVNDTSDWPSIKSSTGCFFIPEWTFLGTDGFLPHLTNGTADGAFSWDAWPEGANDMTLSADHLWKDMLGATPYMMPVSPWFYTSLTQWNKNWLWRGDDMWYQRWQDIIAFQPELVEILTWNDFGESHYIGPVHKSGIPSGAWYVDGMDHTGWLAMLPYYIDAYKAGTNTTSALATDFPAKISYWYKVNPGLSCGNNGTTGNDPARQTILAPALVTRDMVFLDVLVERPSDVYVTIGGNEPRELRAKDAGISHFSVPLNGQTGPVTMRVVTCEDVWDGYLAEVTGPPITTDCVNGLVNWNAVTGSSS